MTARRAGWASGRTAALAMLATAFAYAAALALADSRRDLFGEAARIAAALPALAAASLLAYLLRFWRWRWLLARHGCATPLGRGLLAYLAGFAFTATPGKVGELARLRYFERMGVPAATTVACFVAERLLDLVVLLAFCAPIALETPYFRLAAGFVALVVAAVVAAAQAPLWRKQAQAALRRRGRRWPARALRALWGGVERAVAFLRPREALVGAGLGALAWGVQCLGFLVALRALGVAAPAPTLFAIQPIASLVGAASMLPGGVGSTEAATVALLVHYGVDLALALSAAIALRLGSIWFATLLGLAAVAALEARGRK